MRHHPSVQRESFNLMRTSEMAGNSKVVLMRAICNEASKQEVQLSEESCLSESSVKEKTKVERKSVEEMREKTFL